MELVLFRSELLISGVLIPEFSLALVVYLVNLFAPAFHVSFEQTTAKKQTRKVQRGPGIRCISDLVFAPVSRMLTKHLLQLNLTYLVMIQKIIGE